MPSDNCNNAHVTELRCVIIGNFRFSNRYQSEEHEMEMTSGQTFGFLSDPAYHVFSVFISVYL